MKKQKSNNLYHTIIRESCGNVDDKTAQAIEEAMRYSDGSGCGMCLDGFSRKALHKMAYKAFSSFSYRAYL